jgi:hypothetical protein
MESKRVFICADHGLAIFYFLKSEIVPVLIDAGNEVIMLTEDNSVNEVRERFGRPGLTVEGLRLDQVQNYVQTVSPSTQWWLDFLRRAGPSDKINLAVPESYIGMTRYEAGGRRKTVFPFVLGYAKMMRKVKPLRKALVNYQGRFTPNIYSDLFEKYQPDLVIAASPGFRHDRYLLREATARNIPTMAVIISWDSPSSYGLPGAKIDWATCWSEIQRQELVRGSDWQPERVNIGGMPPYDGYVTDEWVMPREAYFKKHGLDPNRKLLTYASSFTNWSPTIQNVEALVDLVSSDKLVYPSQLLVRLHPVHMSGYCVPEADRIRQIAQENPLVHVVEPIPFAALGHYSIEDLTERASMMAHADIFLTVFSTMCVEASFKEHPIISVCIDSPNGYDDRFWLPLSEIGIWPTHSRFSASGAGRVVKTEAELQKAVNDYLQDPQADLLAMRRFLKQEVTFTDGSAGKQTARFILELLENGNGSKAANASGN